MFTLAARPAGNGALTMTIYDFPSGDPFNGDPVQANRMRAIVKVVVDGVDVTSRLQPFLISVRVIQYDQNSIELELDDRDGRLPIPPIPSPIQVTIGWSTESGQLIANGQVSEVISGFNRQQGGRRMWVRGTAVPFYAGIKTPFQMHLGDGTPPGKDQGTMHSMTEWLTALSVASGVPVQIHPSFANVFRDYWSINNESIMHHAKRLVDENGGLTYQDDNALVVTQFGERPDGSQKTIEAAWGKNLIGWRLQPLVARTVWGSARQQYFHDRLGNTTQILGTGLAGSATYQRPNPAPNASAAQQHASMVQENIPLSGHGQITINGEPSVKPQDTVKLIGARPGIDGPWIVQRAEHLWSREGYVTWLTAYTSRAAYDAWKASGALPMPPLGAGLGG